MVLVIVLYLLSREDSIPELSSDWPIWGRVESGEEEFSLEKEKRINSMLKNYVRYHVSKSLFLQYANSLACKGSGRVIMPLIDLTYQHLPL
jgi:hypothetical protein